MGTNGIEDVQKRNADLLHESAVHAPDSKIGFIAKSVLGPKKLASVGPCALQSFEQAHEIITCVEQAAVENMTVVIRLCPFKPRSLAIAMDGTLSWTGIGLEEGKKILIAIQEKHPGVRIFAEIMDGEIVHELANLLDGVWIGNREGRDTIKKVTHAAAQHHIPIVVKNSSLPDDLGIEDMKERMVTALAAASIIDERGRCTGLSTVVLAMLRGTPAGKTNAIYRNFPNTHWIGSLRQWDPRMVILVDGAHIPKHEKEKGSHDPQATKIVQQTIVQAISQGANGISAEITASIPSKTDPGVDAHAFLTWLSTLDIRQLSHHAVDTRVASSVQQQGAYAAA